MIIRAAKFNDLDDFIDLMECFYREMREQNPEYAKIPYSPKKTKEFFRKYLINGNCSINVIEHKNHIVGVFAAFITDLFYSDKNIAIEELWYVLPEYRNSINNLKLF